MKPNDENIPAATATDEQPHIDSANTAEANGETYNINAASHDAAFDDTQPNVEAPQDELSEQADAEPEPQPVQADEGTTPIVQETKVAPVAPAEMRAAAEAVLFVADGPLTVAKIASVLGSPVPQIREIIGDIANEYQTVGRGFRLEEIAGGWQMLSDPRFVEHIKAMFRSTESGKITAAMLETLSIVAYKQPIMRADVEAIRGVQAGPMLRALMEKGLVRIAGRADIIGKPFLYGTTKKFLEHFGLRTLKDLPQVEELRSAPEEN